jgi:hypothetical protein
VIKLRIALSADLTDDDQIEGRTQGIGHSGRDRLPAARQGKHDRVPQAEPSEFHGKHSPGFSSIAENCLTRCPKMA